MNPEDRVPNSVRCARHHHRPARRWDWEGTRGSRGREREAAGGRDALASTYRQTHLQVYTHATHRETLTRSPARESQPVCIV